MNITVTTRPVTDRPIWSATRLKTLLTCPRQFRYAYVDLIPTPATAPLVFGRMLHETLCFLHERHMAERQLPPIMEVLQQFDRLWSRALDEERPLFRKGAPSPQMHTTIAHEVLRAFLSAQEKSGPPLLAELAFEVEAAGHTLCGIIDRVDEGPDGLIIVDFKSGQRKPPLAEVERDLQLTLYAFAARQVLRQPVERVVYYHLRDGSQLTATRDESHFNWLLDTVLPHAVTVLEREQFPPHYGYWCNFCDFREICRAQNAVEQNAAEQKGKDSGVKGGEEPWPTPPS